MLYAERKQSQRSSPKVLDVASKTVMAPLPSSLGVAAVPRSRIEFGINGIHIWTRLHIQSK
jgi:hypothetical protein